MPTPAFHKAPSTDVSQSPAFLTPISEPQLVNWTSYNPHQDTSSYGATMAGVPVAELPTTSNAGLSNLRSQNYYETTSRDVLDAGSQSVSNSNAHVLKNSYLLSFNLRFVPSRRTNRFVLTGFTSKKSKVKPFGVRFL